MKMDLQELKKRWQTRAVLALTIETGRIAASLVRRDEYDARAAQSLSIPIGDEEVLKNPDAAGQALAAALAAAGIRERQCVVGVPPGWALTASTDLPEVGDDDLRGFLELQAEREFSVAPGDLRLGYCPYFLPSGQRRATLAALSAKKIAAVERMLEVAHRRATSISLALDRCYAQPDVMLHFLTNGNHTDVVVTAGGGVAGLRSLAGPQVAEGAVFDPVAFCRDVRITLGRLPEPVRQQIRNATFAGPSAQTLCVAARYDLLRMGIESPDCDFASIPVQTTPQAPGAATETARRKLNGQAIAFEFVVPEAKRWQVVLQRFDTTRRRRLVLAGVGILLLPLLLLFVRSEMENHLQGRWDAMSADAGNLDALQQRIHQFRPWFEPAPQGLQIMESLVSAFPDGGDVWAKSIQVSEGYKVTCTGFAHTQPALLALMERMRGRSDIKGLQVQQIRGENPVQFILSYQWESQHDR